MYVSVGFRVVSILLVALVELSLFAHELLEESIVLLSGDKLWVKCVYANIFEH